MWERAICDSSGCRLPGRKPERQHFTGSVVGFGAALSMAGASYLALHWHLPTTSSAHCRMVRMAVGGCQAIVDVMKMMRDAQGLPEEKFDAH